MCSPISISENEKDKSQKMNSSACENYDFHSNNFSNQPQNYYEQQQPSQQSLWTEPYNPHTTIPLTHSQYQMEYNGIPLISLPPIQSHSQMYPLMSHSQHAYSRFPTNYGNNMFPVQPVKYYYPQTYYYPQAASLMNNQTTFPIQNNTSKRYHSNSPG